MTRWKISQGSEEIFVSTDHEGTKRLLGNAITMWARDRDLSDWDHPEEMAGICFHWTDLGEREIREIFGISGEHHDPGSPPWTICGPDGQISIEKG